MKLVISKRKQFIGMLVGFSIIVNGKKKGKVYNNSPLIIEGDWKEIDIEAKQFLAKAKLHIKKPNNIENLEVSYSIKDIYFLLYGFILTSLLILYMFLKLRIFNYFSLIVLGLFAYHLSKITIKRLNK